MDGADPLGQPVTPAGTAMIVIIAAGADRHGRH